MLYSIHEVKVYKAVSTPGTNQLLLLMQTSTSFRVMRNQSSSTKYDVVYYNCAEDTHFQIHHDDVGTDLPVHRTVVVRLVGRR